MSKREWDTYKNYTKGMTLSSEGSHAKMWNNHVSSY